MTTAAQSSPLAGISWMKRHSSGVLSCAYTSWATTSAGISSAFDLHGPEQRRVDPVVLSSGQEQVGVELPGGGEQRQVGGVVVGSGDEGHRVLDGGVTEDSRLGGIADHDPNAVDRCAVAVGQGRVGVDDGDVRRPSARRSAMTSRPKRPYPHTTHWPSTGG